ncbi:hypothetical protein FISHEDRAFT_57733 [Fistulina hepatica ATCC 64428]|uniref:Uncharacterized protein n=1 Tax=Fistulina hepatica ATCC 64428 TaxID=1128425 RepID=A0A0D7AI48_9AGAR|nr:hypothetical protein FISHEDRAFT_57733 [Fistulina hepatica ATCC 64428]
MIPASLFTWSHRLAQKENLREAGLTRSTRRFSLPSRGEIPVGIYQHDPVGLDDLNQDGSALMARCFFCDRNEHCSKSSYVVIGSLGDSGSVASVENVFMPPHYNAVVSFSDLPCRSKMSFVASSNYRDQEPRSMSTGTDENSIYIENFLFDDFYGAIRKKSSHRSYNSSTQPCVRQAQRVSLSRGVGDAEHTPPITKRQPYEAENNGNAGERQHDNPFSAMNTQYSLDSHSKPRSSSAALAIHILQSVSGNQRLGSNLVRELEDQTKIQFSRYNDNGFPLNLA